MNGNPETATDPTGQRECILGDDGHQICPPASTVGGGGSGTAAGTTINTSDCLYHSKPCSPTNNSCNGTTNVWNANTEKCDPAPPDRREELRKKKLAELDNWAFWETLAGYALFLVGDGLIIFDKAKPLFEKLAALIDFLATIGNSILPMIGQKVGGAIGEALYHAGGILMGLLGTAHMMISAIRTQDWFEQEGLSTLYNIITAGAGGAFSVIIQALTSLIGPILGHLLDMGGHLLQARGLEDYRSEMHQQNMPIQAWCIQYGQGQC